MVSLSFTLSAAHCFILPARAVDISTHSFSSCGFPDTGQKIWYDSDGHEIDVSTAAGESWAQDATYNPGANQPKYTVYKLTPDSLVTVDDRTGLMWTTNPGSISDIKSKCNWDAPPEEPGCTWALAVSSACEDLVYAGYEDWRLPNIRELMSIVDYQKYSPAINTAAFPDTVGVMYWSSTMRTYLYNVGYDVTFTTPWGVNFSDGVVTTSEVTSSYRVRCVRGGP